MTVRPSKAVSSHRRTHKKSRLGCDECKRRHIKCDEARPSCDNCSTSSRTCVYLTQLLSIPSSVLSVPHTPSDNDTPSAATTRSPSATYPHAQPLTPALTPFSVVSSAMLSPSAQDRVLYPPLNMRHMQLFSHFILETGPSLDPDGTCNHEDIRLMIPAILSAPWLMYQVLALSAMHLSCTQPIEAKRYRNEATALQMQALSLNNNNNVTNISSENCEAMLIFASFLGLHTLAEAVTASEANEDGFMDRFITYLNLHRGVRVVTQQAWKTLKQSNVSTLLKRAEHSLNATSLRTQGHDTVVADHLSCLLDQADLNAESDAACRDAVSLLQLIYQTESSKERSSGEGHQQAGGLIWTWPILSSGTFAELLAKRRTEALIILCYYAVLLHQHRHTWFVGNAGRLLIDAITKFLGNYWSSWLDWPNQMLEDSS